MWNGFFSGNGYQCDWKCTENGISKYHFFPSIKKRTRGIARRFKQSSWFGYHYCPTIIDNGFTYFTKDKNSDIYFAGVPYLIALFLTIISLIIMLTNYKSRKTIPKKNKKVAKVRRHPPHHPTKDYGIMARQRRLPCHPSGLIPFPFGFPPVRLD